MLYANSECPDELEYPVQSGPSCSKRHYLNEFVSGQNVNCSSKHNI